MNLATVAVKNIRRHVLRNTLTILGVGVATLAFILLRTTLSAWAIGTENAAKDRIATRHKVTFIIPLPSRYVQEVRAVDGVQAATWMNWFGGRVPGREEDFFASMACDPETLFQVYDELQVVPEQRQAFMENRQGALVGEVIAKQFGWQVGDQVTLEGSLYPGTWRFTVEGIYRASRRSLDQSSFFFHWNYLNERADPLLKDQVGWIVSRVANADKAALVSKTIDQHFDVRDIQTLSMSERAVNASFMSMLATILKALDFISLVVVVIMMLILGNTIAMGVRERTREYGALRAIGFLPQHLAGFVLGEAALIGALGGLVGTALAIPLVDGAMGPFVEENFSSLFPYFRIQLKDVLYALLVATVGALLAAGFPARQASNLRVSEALRRVA